MGKSTAMRVLEIRSRWLAGALFVSFSALRCGGAPELPAGEIYRSGDQSIRSLPGGAVELTEKGETIRGRCLIDGETIRISTDRSRVFLFDRAPEGLKARGGGVFYDSAARRKRSAAVRRHILADLVWLPGGKFVMGSNDGEPDERPVHTPVLHSFSISRHEVTVEEWNAVMGGAVDLPPNEKDLPVTNVSWNDARDFVEELNGLENGSLFRLPTESQWEFAARAGSGGRYFFGDAESELKRSGWYAANSNHRPHAVGGLQPNKLGLYDVHGNVWEWCDDRFGSYPDFRVKEPAGPKEGSLRVRRGGGYANDAKDCRSSKRDGARPESRSPDVGFRLVKADSH